MNNIQRMRELMAERDAAVTERDEMRKALEECIEEIKRNPWGLHDEPIETERDEFIFRIDTLLAKTKGTT